MFFDGEPSIVMPPLEKCIRRKMLFVTLTLNPWPWKCHQCHVYLVMS